MANEAGAGGTGGGGYAGGAATGSRRRRATRPSLVPLVYISDDIWREIRKLAREIAREEIELWEKGYRPGGLVTVSCTMGTPGITLTPSATTPWAHIVIPFPCRIYRIEYYGVTTGSVTTDVRILKSGGGYGDEINGPAVPNIGNSIERYRPGEEDPQVLTPGSLLVFYVTAVSGAPEVITANVILRCV